MIASALALLRQFTPVELVWLAVGFLAQAVFSARFLVQWIASERVRRSIVPEAFWYLSLLGGVMLLAYAIHRRDPVFILGQAFGLLVYARNVYFLRRSQDASRGEGQVNAAGGDDARDDA